MATQSIAEHEIAALARPILEDRFRNQIEILSVRTGQHQGRLTMDVSYRGDPAALHPQRFKGISRRIRPQLQAMGMRDQLIERYTQTTDEEWNARAQAPHGQTTDGEWSELVQATTEIDTSLPIDRAEFERLAEEWLEQRPRGVDVAQMIRHPAYYQSIIDIGAEGSAKAGPKPRHWFYALNQRITDAQPVQPEHQGNIVQATTEIDTSLPIDRAEFERLAEEWLEQRPRGVDVAQMIRHPAYYQSIIDIGAEAVPWLLERLAQSPEEFLLVLGALNQPPTRNWFYPNTRATNAMAEEWIA